MEQPISYELLNKIDSPEDLRHLPIESLPESARSSGIKSLMNFLAILGTLVQV